MTTPIAVYDFTFHKEHIQLNELKQLLKQYCKLWTFQLEEGELKHHEHYQGRFSLKVKARKSTVIKHFTGFCPNCKNMHITPTSNQNMGNDFYVTKEEGRIAGPWSNADIEKYVPRQIREIKELYPWQQHIVDDAEVWNTRNINWIHNVDGNIGKSIIKTYIGVHGIGRTIPFSKDYRDIMRMVMCTETKPLYIIDIPKGIKKDDLGEFLAGIETIKDGYAYDDRYSFKEKYFDCPNIWIFSNTKPNSNLLSYDRWRLWNVSDEHELVNEDF